MARNEGLTFLGSLPVDTELVTLLDAAEKSEPDDRQVTEEVDGQTNFKVLDRYLKTSSWKLFEDIVAKAIANIDRVEDHGASSD